MALFTRSLWPDNIRRPYLRLAGAMVAAPLILAAALTLLAFLVAGSTEPDRASTLVVTRHAAGAFFTALPAFTLSFGLAGVALLWTLGRSGVIAWLATGAAAGAIVAGAHGLLVAGGIAGLPMVAAMGAGLILFALIRWIAGVRGEVGSG